MKKIVLAVLAAGCVYAALHYHFILTDNSLKILKKTDTSVADTFIDARGEKRASLYLNPALVKAGIRDAFKDDGLTISK
ncbi:MAG: hypothetical protein R6X27_04545 [Candidatus Desulfacyla sp.]